MVELPAKFIDRMKAELGDGFPGFIACYEEPPKRGLRVNTLRIPVSEFCRVSPWPLEPTGILGEGFVVNGAENVGRHPFHAAGLFYMQEPSAMSVIEASGADDSGLRVLDMCAAPGGKTGGVAARMRGEGIIIANEIVPKRAKLLAQNIERLGIANAAVTCERPDAVAKALPGYFDIVMVDAPCSGEGMFRKDPVAMAEWSPEHVASCAERQKLILESAAECVSRGGHIVYSTCTFSHDENEGVIEHFLSDHGDFSIEHMERLYPHTSCGEGHFVCRLRREGERRTGDEYEPVSSQADKKVLSCLDEFVSSALQNVLPEGAVLQAGDRLKLVPIGMPKAVLGLRTVACGVDLGEMKKGRFEPSHTFFMACLGQKYVRSLDLLPEDPLLSRYLSGNTVPCPEDMRGWSAVCVKAADSAFPIGFGKAVDGVMKNHLPKGLYIN